MARELGRRVGKLIVVALVLIGPYGLSRMKDRSLRDDGARAVEQWTDVSDADRPFARWLAARDHDRAVDQVARRLHSYRGRYLRPRSLAARSMVSDKAYEAALHGMVLIEIEDPTTMSVYARDVLEKNPGDVALAGEALRWARRSVDLSPGGQSPAQLKTLARALRETGRVAQALEVDREAALVARRQ
jgi:hypothetical protein